MPLKVLDNPLLKHKLNAIRDKRTSPERLRGLVEELTLMCIPYLMEDAPIRRERIETPLEEGIFVHTEGWRAHAKRSLKGSSKGKSRLFGHKEG